jgi:hypothetical protein
MENSGVADALGLVRALQAASAASSILILRGLWPQHIAAARHAI